MLKEGARSSGAGPRNRFQSGSIVAEVALSLILLVGAGLLLNSFVRLSNVPPGVNTRNVLTMQVALSDKKYPDSERSAAFFERTLERIENLPGVEAAGVTGTMPMAGWWQNTTFSIIGRAGQPAVGYETDFDFCTPDYFRAAGILLVKGRAFTMRDIVIAPGVVIINEALAREHFPNEEPLGKRIHLELFTGKIDAGWEIVGIVGNVHQRGLGERVRPCVYRPYSFSFGVSGGNLVIRTKSAPLSMAESVRKAILKIDPTQPVANVRTLDEVIAALVAQRRFVLLLLGGFAGVALLLAAIGLYGVIAYTVSQRTHEFGIRISLGATRSAVLQLVLRQGMKLAGIGVLLGTAGGLGLTRVLTGLLYEVTPTDPATFLGVSLLLVVVALSASWLAARRAAKVDPMEALRCG